jgi:hypothetical protein
MSFRDTLKMHRYLIRMVVIVLLSALLSGCVYWRLLQTKLQLNDFDQYFSLNVADDLTWHFKQPLLYSDDFIYLAKLQPSSIVQEKAGQKWQLLFRKINDQGDLIKPEISYFFTLKFNHQQKLTDLSLSPEFLKMAPPEFLEASLRSLGRGDIFESKRQLKVSADKMLKIPAKLPKQTIILKYLGLPLEKSEEDGLEVFFYRFKLETPHIDEGYEDRAISDLKLWFDKKTLELVKFGGRFAGLKLRIDYREYQQTGSENQASL